MAWNDPVNLVGVKFLLIPVIFSCMFPSWCVSGVGLRKIKEVMEEKNRGPVQERGLGFNLRNSLGLMGSMITELERMLITKIQYR